MRALEKLLNRIILYSVFAVIVVLWFAYTILSIPAFLLILCFDAMSGTLFIKDMYDRLLYNVVELLVRLAKFLGLESDAEAFEYAYEKTRDNL